ncbi:hypothetical protein [Bradyrhizobium viridifuturi]|uniref:hypothetical protein n=1 Tax=Bradyrhizobium viridifuturi TaxID=1654716 RepID=UPI000AE68FCB|nr:hypothetical protein [Bradyrhizobium viridifuturi]
MALLLRVVVPGDVRVAMGIVGVQAAFLEMLPLARILYRNAIPKSSPAGMAKLTVRNSCAH